MGVPFRLTPTMVSRKLLVLRFIYDYWAENGGSPSFGEIAAALDTNTSRVADAVHSLAAEQRIILLPGARGIRLPDVDEAIRRLRAAGYVVNEDARFAHPQTAAVRVMNTGLPLIPALDHIPAPGGGMADDDRSGQQG